jgi:hypothetical protein
MRIARVVTGIHPTLAVSGVDRFYRMLNRAFPKKGNTLELALGD